MITQVKNGQTYTQIFDIENILTSVTVSRWITQVIYYDGNGNIVLKVKADGNMTRPLLSRSALV